MPLSADNIMCMYTRYTHLLEILSKWTQDGAASFKSTSQHKRLCIGFIMLVGKSGEVEVDNMKLISMKKLACTRFVKALFCNSSVSGVNAA